MHLNILCLLLSIDIILCVYVSVYLWEMAQFSKKQTILCHRSTIDYIYYHGGLRMRVVFTRLVAHNIDCLQ
jgi:hypothetical protein